MTYIIGDIHGQFKSLSKLINKLPNDAKLIFVGDLVDRGIRSKDVVAFVKENKHQCVMGNHEKLMIDCVKSFESSYPATPSKIYENRWIRNGGTQTLLSYGIIEIDKSSGKFTFIDDREKFDQFLDDVKWTETLPLYIELDIKKDDKPIVISHASIADIWNLRDDKDKKAIFQESALWNRESPKVDVEIFNIFGHTIQKDVDLTKHYINVDTGCCYLKYGYGKLSAYCVEENCIISV